MGTTPFLRNLWYVAGWSADLAPGDRVGRLYLNKPVVLWRDMDGQAHALEDRCVHRAMPLSAGVVEGKALRCPYHGLEFGGNGRCTRIPAQDKIPETAKVRAYPLVEKQGIMWIWMGDVERADPARVPNYPIHEDPTYAWRSAHFPVKGNWQLLVDNLMDLSHLPYIHARTIGGNPELHFSTRTQSHKLPNGVRVARHMPNSEPPPTYVDAAGFQGRIDRWQEIEFEPVLIRIHTGACEAGTGAYEGRRDQGFSMRGFHGITPETETTTHYFWSMATNILTGGVPDEVFEQTARTFREDQDVLEMQQERMLQCPDEPLLDIASDVGGRHTRQLIARLLREDGDGDGRRRPHPAAAPATPQSELTP
ncbi:aromatic ring-hydroxylating dioxygenase subunit alpha [Novosphingobium profundi]|uniref:aromatic ring-hydroxylating oxygenase subunit alpha n=1 Tax=Novosphingobium profundi TaxID=1774954 RepID=UPI001BD9A3C2|nr:aromatic ring-hydroxylating dioxygenase subunit alpha [Novosphingobium profundi]MBT0669202.1 aromatic ring-hydroxylating dioxygenase subunit alpha [Novosphingobium profundi]